MKICVRLVWEINRVAKWAICSCNMSCDSKSSLEQEKTTQKCALPEAESVCVKLVTVSGKLSEVKGFDLAVPSANVGC